MAQKSVSDYTSVNFYGIDFAPVKVIGADEPASSYVAAFKEINELLLSEYDKYVSTLAGKLKMTVDKVDIQPVVDNLKNIDTEELKPTHTVPELTEQDLLVALQDLNLKPAKGLGLVVTCGELNKGTNSGIFHYVFFDNQTMDIIDVLPIKGKAAGFGLRNFWANAFYRTIQEVNPTELYQSKKKIKEGVTGTWKAVKKKVAGDGDD